MALATLYNVPSDPREFNVFSFNNFNEHLKIAEAIFRNFGVATPNYVLDPLPLTDPGVWLYEHQNLHNIMNGILGTNSNDLTSVDFQDKDQISQWIWLHAQEHYYAADKLQLK